MNGSLLGPKNILFSRWKSYSASRDKFSYGVLLLYRQAWRDGLTDSL